jgi:membrane associated rhomboid family serine protease
MMNIADQIRSSFRNRDIVIKLILINVFVFVAIGLVFVFYMLFTPGTSLDAMRSIYSEKFLKYLMVPSLPVELLRRPWTIITYMFTHFNLWHIFFNMLMLYWFGRIFLQYLTPKQLVSTYIIGGISGALLFLIFLNGFPGLQQHLGSSMLGASAAIMAIMIAISFYVPDYTIYLLFIGPVKLKYVAAVVIAIDVLMIASYNAGGHIAHLGGALYGYYFIRRFRKGKDPGKWLNDLIDWIVTLFKPRSKLNVSYRKQTKVVTDEEYLREKAEQQHEIDQILDKIAQGGYESLTKKEKETLFKMSNRKN